MNDIKKDPFEEYIKQSEPSKKELCYSWYTAIGLQAADGLETSEYLKCTARKNIEGEISFPEAGELIESYYNEHAEKNRTLIKENRTLIKENRTLKLANRISNFQMV